MSADKLIDLLMERLEGVIERAVTRALDKREKPGPVRRPDDELMSSKEAAAFLGLAEGTLEVDRCQRRMKVPYLKVGRLVKYRRSELQAYLDGCERERPNDG